MPRYATAYVTRTIPVHIDLDEFEFYTGLKPTMANLIQAAEGTDSSYGWPGKVDEAGRPVYVVEVCHGPSDGRTELHIDEPPTPPKPIRRGRGSH